MNTTRCPIHRETFDGFAERCPSCKREGIVPVLCGIDELELVRNRLSRVGVVVDPTRSYVVLTARILADQLVRLGPTHNGAYSGVNVIAQTSPDHT